MGDEWSAEEPFDDDHLHFYAPMLSDEVSDAQAGPVWSLIRLEAGTTVVDLACGHGRIANRLAARGAAVTGIDITPRFLEIDREDAARRGVSVDYVEGDLRRLPWTERFDAAVCCSRRSATSTTRRTARCWPGPTGRSGLVGGC